MEGKPPPVPIDDDVDTGDKVPPKPVEPPDDDPPVIDQGPPPQLARSA